MVPAGLASEERSFSDQGVFKMVERRDAPRSAPVVQLLVGLKRRGRPAKQEHDGRATVDDFEREHMGIAAKE